MDVFTACLRENAGSPDAQVICFLKVYTCLSINASLHGVVTTLIPAQALAALLACGWELKIYSISPVYPPPQEILTGWPVTHYRNIHHR